MSDPTPGAIGELRVWNIINLPNPPTWYNVASPEEAWRLIDRIAKAQLGMPWVHSNAFGLSIYEADGWNDWESPEGDDLDAWAETQGIK